MTCRLFAALASLVLAGAAHGADVLLFTADWCGPCQVLKSKMKKEGILPSVQIRDCTESDAYTIFSKKYGFRGVPQVIVLEDGKEIARGGLEVARKYAKGGR